MRAEVNDPIHDPPQVIRVPQVGAPHVVERQEVQVSEKIPCSHSFATDWLIQSQVCQAEALHSGASTHPSTISLSAGACEGNRSWPSLVISLLFVAKCKRLL